MNPRKRAPALLAALLVLGFISPAAQAQFAWTGLTSTQDVFNAGNWQGGVAPTFSGSEDLILGKAINNTLSVTADISVNSISLTANDDYHFVSGAAQTITIGSSLHGSLSGTNNRLIFDSNIDFTTTVPLTIDAGNSTIAIAGKINGSADVYLSNSRGGTSGSLIFNGTSTGSTYTGNTYLTGISGNTVVIAFWNDHPFGDGTGTLNIQNSAQLIAHGSRTVLNPMILSATGATDPIFFKSWDDTLHMAGDVTLANNTNLVAQQAQAGIPSPDNMGVYPIPGPRTRHAIEFAGAFGESGGSRTLTVSGPGVMIFGGNNTYTGGTTVNGALVFESTISAPGGANKVKVNANGYAGFSDYSPTNFATFLSTKIDQVTSTGAVGVDTLPGFSTFTFVDAIDLSGFTAANIRIGSATSAILTGLITPQGTNFQFGNGGGTLFVQSNLTGGRAVGMNNASAVPLTLYLQGNNNYNAGTNVANGFVIFDGPNALPGSGALTAAGVANSYIGYTDVAGVSNVANFLAKFNTAGTYGIIGFDTHAGNSTVNLSDSINLTTAGFNNGVYLGTATGAVLSGTLTPTLDGILRLTASHGSTLQVDNLSGSLALSLGTPAGTDSIYSDGIIYLPNANTYTGGTTVNSTLGGITLRVGANASLGIGALTIPQGVIAGLQGSVYGVALANPIVFSAGASPGQLFITDYHGIELDGDISGPGSISAMEPSYTTLTLAGNNTFTGDINLFKTTLYLNSDNAAGLGTIHFINNSTVNFNTVSPVIHGLQGADGTINMNDGLDLTIDMSNPLNSHDFGGFIGNESPPNATLTVTSSTGGDALYLYGNSNYASGTFITNKGAVALGNDHALGAGPVTLNTTMAGGLALNAAVTFSNDLIYTGGTLQGFGTFAPASVNSVAGGPVIFDSGKGIVAGVYGLGSKGTNGKLTLATGADFASGGAYLWTIQDGIRSDGFSTLVVDGTNNLNISATSGSTFTVFLASLDSLGAPGFASNLTLGSNNMFLIATTTGGGMITTGGLPGFDATDFTVDTSLFSNPVTSVFLTADANNLWINFTPVPEPSTYALLGLGLGAVLFPAIRRRKRV